MNLSIGNIVEFGYCAGIGDYPKIRNCHIEEIGFDDNFHKIVWIKGYDTTIHGYRTFLTDKMTEIVHE